MGLIRIFWFTLITLELVSQIAFSEECSNIPDKETVGLYRLACSTVKSLPIRSKYSTTTNAIYIGSSSIGWIPVNSFYNFPNIKFIRLLDCNIRYIHEGAFRGLKQLNQLYINYNNIKNIRNGVFNGLADLKLLDLSHNSLEKIERWATKDLKSLQYISVSGNKLQEVIFLSEISTLEFIDITRNKITFLHPSSFNRLHQLSYLNMSFNEITFIQWGTFKDLKNLQVLDLSHNKLTSIMMDYFLGLNMVMNLDISNNHLQKITAAPFHMLERLQYWNIDNNRITEFETKQLLSLLIHLKQVRLDGNNLMCSVLLGILGEFRKAGVVLTSGSDYDKHNINGIACRKENTQDTANDQPASLSKNVDVLMNLQNERLHKIVDVLYGVNGKFEKILNELSYFTRTFNQTSTGLVNNTTIKPSSGDDNDGNNKLLYGYID